MALLTRPKKAATAGEIQHLHEHPQVAAELRKLDALVKRRDAVEIELEGMRGQSRNQRKRIEAEALIAGKEPPSPKEQPVRADLVHTLDVIDEAIKIQTKTIEAVKKEAARELRVELTPRRAEILSRMDSAFESLVDAMGDLNSFYNDCERCDLTADWGVGWPWTSAAITGVGDQRWVLEQLQAWRREYAANGFTVA